MKLLGAFLCVVIVLMSFRVEDSNAFVKLLTSATKVELKNNNKIFNVTYTFHNPKSLTNQSLDFEILTMRRLNDLKLTVVYYVMALNGTIQNELVRRSIDLCFFFRNPRSDRLVNSIYDYIKQRSHLPSKCPIPIENYDICNLRLADVPVPAFLPEAEFMLQVLFYSGVKQEISASLILYGKLVRIIENILPTL